MQPGHPQPNRGTDGPRWVSVLMSLGCWFRRVGGMAPSVFFGSSVFVGLQWERKLSESHSVHYSPPLIHP
ncbi:hypothetical protein EYF80_031745 [Liparis tanakae]|uniref:Uncharacterized protein n=1 Tax=Liparis tanakae TaxID=230148 RepID=A0A4Z2GZ65_9TELE|nr:hypothetical protein EYF80_031745 [Liparis tanakae]